MHFGGGGGGVWDRQVNLTNNEYPTKLGNGSTNLSLEAQLLHLGRRAKA